VRLDSELFYFVNKSVSTAFRADLVSSAGEVAKTVWKLQLFSSWIGVDALYWTMIENQA
tara:strand:+ start:1026 stop:1202 length:177 start_codon:yes stop_codon:yes gene_type:complete